jgi:uncharacterized protein
MSGEKDLPTLLASMEPVLLSEEYVFTHFKQKDVSLLLGLDAIGMFMEVEGMTAILPRRSADKHQIAYDSSFSCITLKVHSSLDAVGLTAAVSNALSEDGISANVVAAYYHDHVFVNQTDGARAVLILQQLSEAHKA